MTAQQHLFPDYAQMMAHIVTVINSRTRGPASMMMGNLNEEASNHDTSSDELVEGEDGELCRLEVGNGKRVFTKHRHESIKGNTKGGGKDRTDKECCGCGRIGHIRDHCRGKTHLNGGSPKSAPTTKKRSWKLRGRRASNIAKRAVETIDWGPLKCCQTTETPKKTCEESSFFACWDEQSDVLQQADPWARNAPKTTCSVSKVRCVQSTVASYSSPV